MSVEIAGVPGLPEPWRGRSTRTIGQTLALLAQVRTLIGARSRWTQRALARDPRFRPVEVLAESAARWCLGGALVRVAVESGLVLVENARRGVWRPAAVDLAWVLLAYGCAEQLFPRAGLRLADAGLFGAREQAARREPRLTYASLVFASNDLPQTRHQDVVAAADTAIALAQKALDERRQRS